MDSIFKLLLKLGLHNTHLGFRYIRYALALCLEDENYLLCISNLYKKISIKFSTAPDNVDSCMRTAIAACWNHGNREFLIEITHYNLKHRPTNGEFLDILYCYLKSFEE